MLPNPSLGAAGRYLTSFAIRGYASWKRSMGSGSRLLIVLVSLHLLFSVARLDPLSDIRLQLRSKPNASAAAWSDFDRLRQNSIANVIIKFRCAQSSERHRFRPPQHRARQGESLSLFGLFFGCCLGGLLSLFVLLSLFGS